MRVIRVALRAARRIPDRGGGCEPYIALAAALGCGLWGIENRIEPAAPVTGNAYALKTPAKLALPATLTEAATRLRASKAARSLFGDAFVDHFAATREWEEREFRRHVTDGNFRVTSRSSDEAIPLHREAPSEGTPSQGRPSQGFA